MKVLKNVLINIILITLIILSTSLSACSSENNDEKSDIPNFAVKYINVGEGDATLIKFPDDKVALIDTGAKSDENYHKITEELSSFNIDSIEWLILTHPDSEHIGNAKRIIENFSVKNVYHPDIKNPSLFPTYKEIMNVVSEKEVARHISAWGEDMSCKDYTFKILAPYSIDIGESTYLDFNFTEQPTGTQINNISAVVYLEYKDITFLFTGDAEEKVEKLLIQDAKTGIFNVKLTDLDFLKVGGHGSKNSSCSEFLDYLKPKHAVISSGDSFNNHPATETLLRISESNPDCKILRTDICGNISVEITENGKYEIKDQIK